MKLYIKICIIASFIMTVTVGSYSLLFKKSEETYISAGANAYESEDNYTENVIKEEHRRFVALVSDAVCQNSPYLTKVALCGVIINRCESSGFPNTPVEVVFSDPIFSAAYNIDFNNEPSLKSLEAYDDALAGFSPCPSAMYFYNYDTTDNLYRMMEIVFKSGKFCFS